MTAWIGLLSYTVSSDTLDFVRDLYNLFSRVDKRWIKVVDVDHVLMCINKP